MRYFFSDGSSMEWHEVLELLRENYGSLMYTVANNILHNQDLAEEAVAESFLRLSKYNFKIDLILCNKTKSLMVIISKHVAINIYNAKKKDKMLFYYGDDIEIEDENAVLPLTVVIDHENITEVAQAIKSLDPKYSDIINMKYFKDYSDAEIASLFDISEGTVRSRLTRGRRLLKKLLINRRDGIEK